RTASGARSEAIDKGRITGAGELGRGSESLCRPKLESQGQVRKSLVISKSPRVLFGRLIRESTPDGDSLRSFPGVSPCQLCQKWSRKANCISRGKLPCAPTLPYEARLLRLLLMLDVWKTVRLKGLNKSMRNSRFLTSSMYVRLMMLKSSFK